MKSMKSSTTEIVSSLSSGLQNKLWHHLLGHSGKEYLGLASAACDRTSNLHRHSLFQCCDFIEAKFHKHEKVHHDNAYNPNPEELFQMEYGFASGK